MKLEWTKVPKSMNRYTAETVRYRFIMIVPARGETHLWVQAAGDGWGTKPIAERGCRSPRVAERIAQRFENDPGKPRRLR
jgi:hypothetical protein